MAAACILVLAALLGLKAAGVAGAAGLSFQVNSTADALDANVGDGVCRTTAGACTLRAAIQEANAIPGADAILVPAGTYALAIPPLNQNNITTGDLDITDSLAIRGAGAGSTFVDGGTPPAGAPPDVRGLDRLFEVLVDGGDVSFSGLTVSDGYAAEYGGAIMNNSTAAVIVTAAVLRGNVAGKTGGAIDNHVGGAVAVSESTLSGNYAGESGSAINNNRDGTLTVADSSISGNSAAAVGLDETLRGAGAIANNAELDARGTITVINSEISDNHAGGGRSGAGISNDGGGRITVDRTSFSKNDATADGGAVYSGPGEVTVTDSTFSENSASNGGAISSGGILTVFDGVFTKNAGRDWGGGVHNFNLGGVTIRSSSFSENSALSGGGLANEGSGLVTVESSTFAKNIAVVSAVLDSGDGGGMHSNSGGEVQVSDVVFTENQARGGGGFSNGGGIVRITAAQFSANIAEERGGGILVEGGDVRMVDIDVIGNTSKSVGEGGGGISYAGDKSTSLGESAAIERSRIRDNRSGGEGGGIDSRGDGPLAVVDTTVTANTAVTGGGLHHVGDAPLLVSRSTLSRNVSEQGGGVFVDGDGEATVENSTVSGNRAGQFGGGLLVSSRVAVRSSTVTDNNAPSGGGVNNGGGHLVGDGFVFLANTIVANNPTGGNCAGTITSLGGNLENTNTCQLTQAGDQPGTSPLLGALAENGGPTQTHALRAGSPAQDAAVCTDVDPCPPIDQRAVPRPLFAGHDVGAYESELVPGGEPSPPPPGECPTLPNSLPADRDSWIAQGNPSNNLGSDSSLKIKSQNGSNSRALLRFPLPPLPDGCTTIASAVLRLHAASAKEARTLAAFQAASEWTETGVTWNNQPATTGPAATTSSGQGMLEWDVTTQTLGSYVSGNHGFLVRDAAEGGPGDEQSFSSREKPTDGPPELLLVFDDSTPETAIDAGPASPTAALDATFRFSSDADDATFECSLDGAAFQACTSPHSVAGLAEGPHRLDVRATRKIRAVDPTPATYEWTVDVTAPESAIEDGPTDPTNETSATLGFSGSDNLDEPSQLRFECRLDHPASDWGDCGSPVDYTALDAGRHSFEVRAIDRAGNVGAPAGHGWTIDLTAPETVIDSAPADPSNSSSAEFAFSADEEATFECSLDGEPFGACSNRYEGLGEGTHSIEVRATDRAGNADATPAVFGWRIDLTPPETVVDSGPADPTNITSASFAFSAVDAVSFECRLDGGDFGPCESPAGYDLLAEGEHVFDVRAIDAAGNVDPVPARYSWTVDVTEPATAIDSGPADPTNKTVASFAFSADEAASFECRLDGGEFGPCESPAAYDRLDEGRHSFEVRGIDLAGNMEASPALAVWTIDVTPPETAVDSAPADPSNSSSAEFAFSADEDVTFECSLDATAFAPCSAAQTYESLAEGGHTVEVRAIDRAGNVDAQPAVHGWTIDLTAPETSIGTRPDDPTNAMSASFEFSAGEDARFECRLDGGAFTACSSPRGYEALDEGAHTFDVRALDRAGNVDETPARAVWTVDLTAPESSIVEQPANPTASASARFVFSADEAASFECRLDEGTFAACSSPASYEGLAEGRHSFEVRAKDTAGNLEPIAARAEWTVDVTPPETAIEIRPADPSNRATADFVFSATEESTFACALDDAPFASCSSAATFEALAEGAHSLEVRAVDRAGNVDPRPAVYRWVVDLTPPETTIDARPADRTNSTSASFAFSAGEEAGFECRLDGSAFLPCDSPQGYQGLGEGGHTFDVRAIDRAGNVDSTPVRAVWTIDVTPPESSIDARPADPTNSSSATFAFSADEQATFACSLDGAPFSACSSPISYDRLGEGRHTLEVSAVDGVGNVDATPASHAWTVDQTAPQTTISAAPPDPTNSTAARFHFSSDEPGSGFACSLDGGTFAACGSPADYAELEPGTHTFQVRATDAAGNSDPSPASYTWTIDVAPPETGIDAQPADPTNATGASFSFSAGETGSSFECRLDGGAFAACAGPQLYSGLAEGRHTFDVRAVDAAGNADPSPARYSWTIDVTPPETAIDSGPAATTTATSANFGFSSEPGSTFECSLDDGAFTACTSPREYTALAVGQHEFRVRATDPAANTDGSPATHAWTIEPPPDTTAPETTIDSAPPGLTSSTTASFSFSSSKPGSTFACSLDGAAFAGCQTAREYTGLASGSHQFRVQATDAAGNVDQTPAAYNWTIDAFAPEATIDSGPPALTASTSASFSFSASESGSTFQCSLDGGAFASCSTPQTYVGLTDGTHQFRVRATDAAGNVDATPATAGWTVDTLAPETTISAGPPATTASTSASFSFVSSESGSTFECSLDGGSFGACSSPRQYTGLADGAHQFRVRARDAAGNADGTPAQSGWTVDTLAPETAIDSAPPATTTSTSASFGFSSSESGSTFECSLDGAAFTACTSPRQYTGLGTGSHQFRVRARDAVANLDASPATHTWTIAPPTPTCTTPATLAAAADAWIDENSPATNKGTDSILKVQSKGPRDNFRALVRFPLPVVPHGCVIERAVLRLYAASVKPDRTLQALRIGAVWAENSVSWSNQPTTMGAAATTASGVGYREWDVTSQVRATIGDGADHGFLIRDAVESADAEQQFHSREKGESPPQLVVRFVSAG